MEIQREAGILGPREEYSGPIEKVADIFQAEVCATKGINLVDTYQHSKV